jgi:hypothetical protein
MVSPVSLFASPSPLRGGLMTQQMDRVPFFVCDLPELSSAQRHSCEGSGELGRLPLSGRPVIAGPCGSAWGAARWRPRSTRPMSAAHGFCFQNDRPPVSAHSTLHFPTQRGSHRFTPMISLRRANLRWCEACSSSHPPVSVPLTPRRFAGFPCGTHAWNASVRRRRPAGRTWRPSGRTREPRPPLP